MRINHVADVIALIGTLFIGFSFVLGVAWLLGEPDCEAMKGTNARIPAGCALRPAQ